MYSVEQQALAQLVSAPDIAGDPGIADEFRKHYAETEKQAEKVRARLEALGGSPSSIKDLIMKAGGKGFLLFAKLLPETPGRLVAHAYAYEAMEWAGYQMLIRFAQRVGDSATMQAAEEIRNEEREMMERLERCFDKAEAVVHGKISAPDMVDHLRTHLNEAHALENQAIDLLGKSKDISGSSDLAVTSERNLGAARTHANLLESRLNSLNTTPSSVKDAALGVFGVNWGLFFQAQSDTPAKLAAFVYAFEHLKIAGYELLKRTATRANDPTTVTLCKNLLHEEHRMVQETADTFDSAADATLAELQKQ
jgi:ferritin-like metal-binding protein YciE